ncbi:L,D-transpeptidase [Synechococcus sp. RSCCF101]|nr:L,D-transpeptidase [Synechococcus sp. RSCCF101]
MAASPGGSAADEAGAPQALPAEGAGDTDTALQTSPSTLTEGSGSEAVQEEPVPAVSILLDLSDRQIAVLRDGVKQGSWPVAIGDPRTPTPTGTFRIENKVVNPQYQSTSSGKVNPTIGPSSPLGDRWLGFLQSGPNQFGIHGTPWPHWVNTRAAVTNGCVRMKHDHVRRLFDLVDIGTPIVIQP